jgi:hypothetical protein
MIGAPAVAAWIAHVAFWVLLGLGVGCEAMSKRSAAIFLVLWLAGYVGLPRLLSLGAGLVTPCTAMLDIALVFVVFRGDVRLS